MNVDDNNRESRPGRAARKQAFPSATLAGSFESWDYQYLSGHAGRLYRTVTWLAGIYCVGGTGYLMWSNLPRALAFLLISLAGWACLEVWYFQGRRRLPAFPILAAQLTFLNSIPLLVGNATLNNMTASTIRISAMTVALFLAVLCGGWWLGTRTLQSRPSAWNIVPGGNMMVNRAGLNAAMPLLLFGMVYQIVTISGFIYKLLPNQVMAFLPVLSAFAGAASSLGAFLGGLAVANRPFRAGAILFWIIFTLTFFLFVSNILLSAASALVFACAIGLGFGLRRIPWGFLITAILLVGFLNEGKFVMRGRYWKAESGTTSVQLSSLPGFYGEWAGVSLAMLQGNLNDARTPVNSSDDTGQNILGRLDNFQNLTFIVDLFERGSATPLYGKTYTLIPPLLVPRFLFPDKPRAHAGQILLNLNFGRQTTEEETYATYVAWGLLPEAVGNFGCVAGACFLGLLAGFCCGLLEAWSTRKRLFSVEGLVAAALLVQLAVSYEMVASVLVTSTFQLLVAVITFGHLLRYWFSNSLAPRRSRWAEQRDYGQPNNKSTGLQDDKPRPVVSGQ